MSLHQKRKTLTPRELRLVEGVAAGKSKAQAARDAGYAETTAEKQASTILNRPLVRTALTEALERKGVTLEKVVQPLVDGLKANVVVKDSLGAQETKIPDHKTRMDASSRIVELYGGVPKVGEGTPTTGGLNIFIIAGPSSNGQSQSAQEPKLVDDQGEGMILDIRGNGKKNNGRGEAS